MKYRIIALFWLLFAAITNVGTLAVAQAPFGQRGGFGSGAAAQSQPAPQPARWSGPEKVPEEFEQKFAQMAQEVQQPVAARKLTFESGAIEKTKLFRADPKLLENKFVAMVSLRTDTKAANEQHLDGSSISILNYNLAVGTEGTSPFGKDRRGYPEDIQSLIVWGNYPIFAPPRFGVTHHEKLVLSVQNKLFVEHCLPQDRPSKPMVEFFTSADSDRDIIRQPRFRADNDRNRISSGWEFLIYAPSQEEAEHRAAGLLQLIDGGAFRPMQRFLFAESRKAMEEARKQFEVVAKEAAALRVEEEKLSKPSEISTDILNQLKAQKVMMAVELSGLNARVRACDEMLKDPKKLEISTLQSVNDMKIKAEIERVGIKEKLDQIHAIIDEGDNRQATLQLITKLVNKLRRETSALAESRLNRAKTLAKLYDLYAPLPLKDDKIVISPVEWTN